MERLHGEHLSPIQYQRVHDVVLHLVDTPTRREFRAACRLARQVDSPDLRHALHARITREDAARCRRALWMLTALRRPRLTPTEVLIVRDLLLDDLDEDRWWNQGDWLAEQARNVADTAWIDHVYTVATGHTRRATAAARLLPVLLSSPTDEQRRALTGRVLDVIDHGGDETWFEALTVLADTPALRAELERRRDHRDSEIMRRARWSLGALGLPNGW